MRLVCVVLGCLIATPPTFAQVPSPTANNCCQIKPWHFTKTIATKLKTNTYRVKINERLEVQRNIDQKSSVCIVTATVDKETWVFTLFVKSNEWGRHELHTRYFYSFDKLEPSRNYCDSSVLKLELLDETIRW